MTIKRYRMVRDPWNHAHMTARDDGEFVLYDDHLEALRREREPVARAALATPAPDAVQEAARALLSLSNEAAQPALDACHGHYGQVAVKEFLRAIAGETA